MLTRSKHLAHVLLGASLLALGGTCLAGEVTIEYQAPRPGAFSVGIVDAQGRLLRTVVSGKKIKQAGPVTVTWDGKDDAGRPLPAGDYAWKGLLANVGWEYQLMMGNAGRPPYLTADGKGGWGGVHGHVLDAAADRDGAHVYLLWKQEEGTPALLKVNPRGGAGQFIAWGAHNSWSWGDCQAVATDGKYVYVADNHLVDSPTEKGKKLARSLIWRVDAASGEYANTWPGDNGGLLKVSEIPAEALPMLPPTWQMNAAPATRRSEGFTGNLFGLAVDADGAKSQHLYGTLRVENKLVILNKEVGARVKEIAVPEPAGVAMAPDGNVYVISRQQVLKYSPDGAPLGTVIASGLVAPYDLCVDAAGRIYVSDQGAAMQVKVFTPGGKPVAQIGKAGGRDYAGAWAAMRTNLLFPTGPAVLADGTLYVGEDIGPKRVAIFRKGGWRRQWRLADEWIGPLASGCNMMDIADEQQPQYIYQCYYPLEAVVRYRVDYANKTFVLDAVWDLNVGDRGPTPVRQNAVYQTVDGGGGYVRHFKGNTYLFVNNLPLVVYRVDGYQLIPAATVSMRLLATPSWTEPMRLASEKWASRPPLPPSGNVTYTWHDANGDWAAQESEVDWSTPPGVKPDAEHFPSHQPYVGYDLTVYGWGWKLPCQGLDERGNPVYTWAKAERLPTRPMGELADPKISMWLNTSASFVGLDQEGDIGPGYPGGREINVWVDPDDGSYYYEADIEGKGKGIGWASSGIFARIGRMTKDGAWKWLAGERATGFAKPGQFYKPGSTAGLAKGCVFVTDWNGQMRVWDRDSGLYVGSLFSDGYKGARPDENLISVEYNEAHVFTHPKTGQVYALAGDGEGLKLFKVAGLDGVVRFGGMIALPAGE